MVPPEHSNNMKVATQTDKRKKIYRYYCTIKPTQTCPLWHAAEGGHLHSQNNKTTQTPCPQTPSACWWANHGEPTCTQGRFSIQVCGPAVPCGGKNSLAIFYHSGLGNRMDKCCRSSHCTMEPVRFSWAWGQDFHMEQREQGRLLWTWSQVMTKMLS